MLSSLSDALPSGSLSWGWGTGSALQRVFLPEQGQEVEAMTSEKWRTVFRVIHPDFSKEQYDTREEALAAARDGDRIMKVLDRGNGRLAFVGFVALGQRLAETPGESRA